MSASKKPNPFQKKNGKKTPPSKGKNNQMPTPKAHPSGVKKPACK